MQALSELMKVIGLTDELRGDAEQQCAAGFRAWIAEAEQGTWGNWDELKKHYPAVCQMSADEAHFPLTTNGTGVQATIFFKTRLLLLRCIAPAPVTERIVHRRRISQHITTQKARTNTI